MYSIIIQNYIYTTIKEYYVCIVIQNCYDKTLPT